LELKTPLVSVIITAYNRPEYLKFTLQSINNQTYRNIEILVIDDGSANNNSNKIKEIVKTFENCKYFYKENTGQPDSRNYGITRAKGKFITFCDDDDIWVKNKIELQVSTLQNNLDYGMTTCCVGFINENGDKLNRKRCHSGFNHGYVFEFFLEKNRISSPAPMLKTEIFEKVGFFNKSFTIAEDWEFWRRVTFYYEIFFMDQILAYVRLHPTNMSNDRTGDTMERFLLYRKLNKSLLLWGENRFSKKDFDMIYTIEKKFYMKLLRNHYKGIRKILFLKKILQNKTSDFFYVLKLFLKY
jgi:glycosyltransferase involved in cell wall biosynthesis